MRDITKRFNLRAIGAALIAGSMVLAFSAGAQAYDEHSDRWRDHERHEGREHARQEWREHERHEARAQEWREHERHEARTQEWRERERFEHRRFADQQLIYGAPQPVYQMPMFQAPMQQQAPSGVNIVIPLF